MSTSFGSTEVFELRSSRWLSPWRGVTSCVAEMRILSENVIDLGQHLLDNVIQKSRFAIRHYPIKHMGTPYLAEPFTLDA